MLGFELKETHLYTSYTKDDISIIFSHYDDSVTYYKKNGDISISIHFTIDKVRYSNTHNIHELYIESKDYYYTLYECDNLREI